MIPANVPIYPNVTYVHTETKRAYIVIFVVDNMKIEDVWTQKRVIVYRRVAGTTETFGRFESDFKAKFTRVK